MNDHSPDCMCSECRESKEKLERLLDELAKPSNRSYPEAMANSVNHLACLVAEYAAVEDDDNVNAVIRTGVAEEIAGAVLTHCLARVRVRIPIGAPVMPELTAALMPAAVAMADELLRRFTPDYITPDDQA